MITTVAAVSAYGSHDLHGSRGLPGRDRRTCQWQPLQALWPERLERLFNPATTATLNADAAKDSQVFRAQQIHQKFESGQIREVSVDDNTALVSVEGQILRVGLFNNRVVNNSRKVTVFLRLRVNDDMARNGRYPLVVTNYEERFE